MWMLKDRVPSMNIESPYGGGVFSLPGATGSLLPVRFPVAPVLLAGGLQLGFLAGCSRAGPTRHLWGMLPDGSIPVLSRIGGTVSTVSPRRMTIDDVSQAVEQSRGGPQLVPSGVSTVWTEKTLAEDTPWTGVSS